jgi:hypothetical protein
MRSRSTVPGNEDLAGRAIVQMSRAASLRHAEADQLGPEATEYPDDVATPGLPFRVGVRMIFQTCERFLPLCGRSRWQKNFGLHGMSLSEPMPGRKQQGFWYGSWPTNDLPELNTLGFRGPEARSEK